MVECIQSVTILYMGEPMVKLDVNERDVQVHILQPAGRIWFPEERATHAELERFLHTRHIPNRDDRIEKRYLEALGLLAWDPLSILAVTHGVMAADPVSLQIELTETGRARLATFSSRPHSETKDSHGVPAADGP